VARWWGTGALVALVLIVAGFAQTSSGKSYLQRISVFGAPASYTTIAFSKPQSLPTQLVSKRAIIPISFVVGNHSNRTRSYQWSIIVVQAKHSRRIATGPTTMPAQAEVAVSRAVEITCVSGRVQIAVQLRNPAESIDFWSTCWRERKE
jgi:hypothetical protein